MIGLHRGRLQTHAETLAARFLASLRPQLEPLLDCSLPDIIVPDLVDIKRYIAADEQTGSLYYLNQRVAFDDTLDALNAIGNFGTQPLIRSGKHRTLTIDADAEL